MRILDLICYGSATLFVLIVLLIAFVYFFTGVYACFSKKVKGDLFSKIIVTIVAGCAVPWLFRVAIFFITKMSA